MAVSRPKTHVYYLGNKEQCEKQRPRGFELARRMRQELEMNDYLTMHIAARTTELPNGDSFRILICHDMTWIYILSPEVTGRYEVVEEEWKAFDLYVDPVVCFSTETGEKIECSTDNKCTGSGADTAGLCESKRLFERTKIELDGETGDMVFTPREFSSFGEDGTQYFDTENFAARMALNTLCEAMSKTSTHGTQRCYSSWSKTLDEYTAHAVLYYDANVEMNKWAVVYDKAGVGQQFKMVPGGTGFIQWPADGYLDVIWCSNMDPYNTTAGYKAFDLWKEDVVEDSGETVGHVFLSITGDTYDRIHVFDLTATSYEAIDLEWRTEYETDNGYAYPAFPEGWKDRHIRLIGLVKRTAYWSIQDHYYGVPIGCSDTVYWENATEQGSVPLEGCSECGAQFAILNEFTQEIEWMDRIACQVCGWEDDATAGPFLHYSKSRRIVNGVTRDCGATTGERGPETSVSSVCKGESNPYTIWGDIGDPFDNCINTWNDNYFHWDCLTSRYVCEQTGMQSGEKENYGRSRICWSYTIQCNNIGGTSILNGAASGCMIGSYPPPDEQGCGACGVVTYDNYVILDDVLSAHIIPDGLGYKYEFTAGDGEVATECDDDDYSTYAETETEVESALFDENFAQPAWPYYPPYAILVAGTSCNKVIKTDKRKFSRRGDRFIDGISMKLSEAFMDANCRFDMDDDKYSIVKGNDNTLYDNKGNEFNRTFEGTDVGFFFFSQDVKKTRKVNDYVD